MKALKNVKKIYYIIFSVVVACVTFLINSCTPEELVSPVTIYLAGYTINGITSTPCYWKNETRTDLPVLDENKDGYATDIQVVEDDVYIAGYITEYLDKDGDGFFTDRLEKPCYWINDTGPYFLGVFSGDLGGAAYAISIRKTVAEGIGIVYTAGYAEHIFGTNPPRPYHWLNEIGPIYLDMLDSDKAGRANDIQFVENTSMLYMAGETQNSEDVSVPCYWRGGYRTGLPVLDENKDGYAKSIQVVGDDIYIAGYTKNSGGGSVPCYWVNGSRIDHTFLNQNGEAHAIQVVGGTVFTAGMIDDHFVISLPCYWINETRIDLPIKDHGINGKVTGMQVVGSTIYTAGISGYSPTYWINETLVELSGQYGQATAIYVVEE